MRLDTAFRTLCLALLIGLLGDPASAAAEACGGPDVPCTVEGGEYHAALPPDAENPPAVIWLHGYARSGKAMIQKAGYVEPFTARGYAVIMPNGQPWAASGKLDWGVVDGFEWARSDIAFIRAVRADAIARFGLDPARILIAGFSRGGSMTWDLACLATETGKAFAAVAGAFWEPMATDCASPVHLFHTHGFNDRLVPFEGRKGVFQGYDFVQGNVMKGIDVLRRENGCMGSAQNSFGDNGSMQKDWSECTAGSIRLRLTTGGHGVPKGWRDDVLDWFEALP